MKSPTLPFLLGALLASPALSTSITKRAPKGEIIVVQPTYHDLDDRSLSHALNCLANWCDEDHFIRAKGGMVRCRTPGDSGAEVFICNVGDVQRCSSTQLSKAINELRQAGSATGAVVHEMTSSRGLKFGFEEFRKVKGEGKGEEVYDATRKHCGGGAFKDVKLQRDLVSDATRGLGKLNFTGWDWVTPPEERVDGGFVYGFERVFEPEDYVDYPDEDYGYGYEGEYGSEGGYKA